MTNIHANPIYTGEPEDLKFAYWVPNVSGGLVVSNIEQRTDWGYDYNNVKLAQTAEAVGPRPTQKGQAILSSPTRTLAHYPLSRLTRRHTARAPA